MKKARYNEEQVVRILREADREPVAEVAKRHGVSEQSIYGWRKRFGEFGVDEVRRQKELEAENSRLRKRRACTLYEISRSGLRYERCQASKDAPVVARMKELAMRYPRYGYRRISIFLARDGHAMSMGRAWRLWNQAALQVPRKRPRRRVAALRPRPLAPSQANQVWSYDFVFDAYANGQQLKCLTLIDEYTRECLAIEVAGSIRSSRVIEVLSRVVSHATYVRTAAQSLSLGRCSNRRSSKALRAQLLIRERRGKMAPQKALMAGYAMNA